MFISESFKQKNKQPLYWYELIILIFIETTLAFSSLGYIEVSPVSITFMTVPVLVGALLLGPREGALLGVVFGLTSMWKASTTTTVLYAERLFSPWLSGDAWGSIILSVGSSVVFGFAAGCLFWLAKRYFNHSRIMIIIAALVSKCIHTMLVYFFMWDIFPRATEIALNGISSMFSISHLADCLITCLIILIVDIVNKTAIVKKMRRQVNSAESIKLKKNDVMIFTVLSSAVLVMSISIFWHFYERIDKIFAEKMFMIPPDIEEEIFHIGMQFLASIISMAGCVALIVVIIIEYSRYMERESECDLMTRLYNRGTMVEKIKERLQDENIGNVAFIMLDIDDFKSINDTYGHPYGDAVLVEVAKVLPTCFRNKDIIGRMGGDEFGIFMTGDYNGERVQEAVRNLCSSINSIQISANGTLGRKISCSIGAVMTDSSVDFRSIYQKADQALYQTKQKGKNGYTFYERI